MGAKILETFLFGDRFWRLWRREKNDGDESKTQCYSASFLPGIKLFCSFNPTPNHVIGQVLGDWPRKLRLKEVRELAHSNTNRKV